ncbi:MAG TPA: VWA domain-containing protein [Bryobacteraceae bacterium]|nr:VWA domain-containing protein [Bryobacteraceae bacterium]
MMLRCLLALCLTLFPLAGATRLLVTVVEAKSGAPVTGLTPADFTVLDDKTPRRVETAELSHDTLDIMLLLDTSLAGGEVQPMAEDFIAQLQPKEQMAVVSFHSSADLIQDFTSSRTLLMRSIEKVKYGNEPHVLDALYAAIDGGFQDSNMRRVILLLTTGIEGDSRTTARDVIRLARRNMVSIYPVYVKGGERSLFESLARQSGGASFNLRDMKKAGTARPGARVFTVMRSHYTLTLAGNLGLGEKLRVEVKRPEKAQVSSLPLD